MSIRLSIVSAGVLPVPAVKGGGVETLIQFFIDENEKHREFEIVLYTVSGAEHSQARYKNTKFINISRDPLVDHIVRKINPILNGLNRRLFQIASLRILDSYEKKVTKWLKTDSSDIVIFENNLTILQRINGVKSKIVFHAHYDDVRPGIPKFDRKKYQYCYNKIDANISVSSFISQRICEVIGNRTIYYTVHNCVDCEKFNKISSETTKKIKQNYGIPESMPVVMYSGRITEEKGVQQLISAFQKLNTEACLVVVGGIFYSDNSDNAFLLELKKMAHSCKNPVIFTGYVDYVDMPNVWSAADIVVVPTYSVEEAAGLVVLEAMAAGKPVIISDSGAMREYAPESCSVLIKRDNFFIENMKKNIEYLCKQKVVRDTMGDNARVLSLNWDKNRYYQDMSDKIKQLIESKY